MNKIITIIVILAVVFVGGYFLFFRGASVPSPSPVSQPSNEQLSNQQPAPEKQPQKLTEQPSVGEEEEYVVTYTNSGYSPSTLKIEKGETVTFKNQSSRPMWPASAKHPTHEVYSGTSLEEHCPDKTGTAFDACKGYLSGESWSFKFDKVGSWKYHDHLNPTATGVIVVE
jgi:plastocyanin